MRRYRRNDSTIQPARSSADGLLALLYNPKREEWIGAYAAGDGLAYLGLAYPTSLEMPDEGLGLGFIDFNPMGECARIHAFPGVAEQGAGLGLCLYAGIAVLAATELDQPCIASAPSGRGFGERSRDADTMWKRMLASRGGAALAYETDLCQGCVAADLEAFIGAGLVGWMARPGQYEGLLLEAAEAYLPSFAAADPHTRDPRVLRIIERVLLAGSLDASTVKQWRSAHAEGGRLVANGGFKLDREARAEVEAHRAALAHLLDDDFRANSSESVRETIEYLNSQPDLDAAAEEVASMLGYLDSAIWHSRHPDPLMREDWDVETGLEKWETGWRWLVERLGSEDAAREFIDYFIPTDMKVIVWSPRSGWRLSQRWVPKRGELRRARGL